MAQYSGYAGAPGSGDTSCAPSQNLWASVDAGLERPGRWFSSWNDFDELVYSVAALPTTEGPYAGLRVFTSTGGYFTAIDAEGGVRKLGSDGDNEGAAIGSAYQPYKIIQNAGELVFEARVKTSSVAAATDTTAHDFFVGLMDSTALSAVVPITATTGTMADVNFVGFLRDTTSTTTAAAFETTSKADGQTVVKYSTSVGTIVADTWIKVGMVFNRGGDNVLRFYTNGVEHATSIAIPSAAGTTFPNDVRMGWVMGVTNSGATNTGYASIDWIKVAQKRVTSAP